MKPVPWPIEDTRDCGISVRWCARPMLGPRHLLMRSNGTHNQLAPDGQQIRASWPMTVQRRTLQSTLDTGIVAVSGPMRIRPDQPDRFPNMAVELCQRHVYSSRVKLCGVVARHRGAKTGSVALT